MPKNPQVIDVDDFSRRADRLKNTISIFDVLEYTKLKLRTDKRVSSQMRCPFHSPDVHPSAHVYEDTNRFYCFRCKVSLDMIGFYATYKGVSKFEAVRELEDLAGLSPLDFTPSLVTHVKEALDKKPNLKSGVYLSAALEEKMYSIRGLLSLEQALTVWHYYDELTYRFKKLKTITRAELVSRLSDLLGTLDRVATKENAGRRNKPRKSSPNRKGASA